MPELPPFLSEQWATAYFQVLFSVLVSAVGIPFLGIQLIMQEDVRHVVTYRTWKIRLWATLVMMLLFSNFLFIWIIHPATLLDKPGIPAQGIQDKSLSPTSSPIDNDRPSSLDPLPSPAENRPATSTQTPGNATKPDRVLPAATAAEAGLRPAAEQSPRLAAGVSPGPSPIANKAEPEIWPWYQSTIAGIVVTIVPILALTVGYWLPSTFTRRKVIKQFETDLISSLKKHKRTKGNTLLKLAYLGEHGNPGIEKQLVLDAYKRIANSVQTDETYKGRELESLIKSISPILLNTEKPGNDDNHKFAAELLLTIWRRVSGKNSYLDATSAAAALKQLGLEAVKSKSDETALRYVKEGALCDDSIVFELGVLAVRTGRFNVATDALNRLEVMAFSNDIDGEDREQAIHSLLGLLANFMAAGESSRKRAERFLTREGAALPPSLRQCVKDAIEYHFIKADFFTADKIIAMERELIATTSNIMMSTPPALPIVPLPSEAK